MDSITLVTFTIRRFVSLYLSNFLIAHHKTAFLLLLIRLIQIAGTLVPQINLVLLVSVRDHQCGIFTNLMLLNMILPFSFPISPTGHNTEQLIVHITVQAMYYYMLNHNI